MYEFAYMSLASLPRVHGMMVALSGLLLFYCLTLKVPRVLVLTEIALFFSSSDDVICLSMTYVSCRTSFAREAIKALRIYQCTANTGVTLARCASQAVALCDMVCLITQS